MAQFAVTSTPTPVPVAQEEPFLLKNTGASTVYLGDDPAVSSTTGYPVAANEAVSVNSGPPFQLYAVCAATQSSTVAVLTL